MEREWWGRASSANACSIRTSCTCCRSCGPRADSNTPNSASWCHANFFDFSQIESELAGFDAAFFCLGATSAGKSEEQYSRVTYDITMAAAEPLARLNPGMTFVFVSGAGTDSTERGGAMWARAHAFMIASRPFMTPKCNSLQDGGGDRSSVYPAESLRSTTFTNKDHK